LVVTPERESLLFDCGWPGFEDRDAKRIEHVLKDVAKLDHLDYLVSTHWHTDHYGGAAQLAKRVKIGHFLDRGLPDLKAENQDAQNYPDGPKADDALGKAYRSLTAGEGKRTALKPGDTVPLKGVEAVVLASGGKTIAVPASAPRNPLAASSPADLPEDTSDNARSLVVKISHGKFDFFDAGDLTWNVEKALVAPVDLIGPIDVYQVTHHGMDISNHPTLLQTIAPTVAIMNNGPRKGGSPATIERLRALPTLKALYALHKNVATKPEQNAAPALTANHDPNGGEFIHLSIAPGGSTYSVRIGEHGEPRAFESK
jgi:beta-lactamase superfamily II metal-dependent hydrolase